MNAIDSLVRLHRWQLDERRRQLADLDQLSHKLRREGERLCDSDARPSDERRERIAESLASIERQIVLAREALAEAYQELKRHELAAANRLMQPRRKLEQARQQASDTRRRERRRRS